MDKAEVRQVLRWLSQEDPSMRQDELRQRRQTSSGQWQLDSPKFQNWVADERQTLFCPGFPGMGKTTISSVVIEELCSKFQHQASIGVAFRSFSRDIPM
jgi:Cdc6-like AAA superfamily ATPase